MLSSSFQTLTPSTSILGAGVGVGPPAGVAVGAAVGSGVTYAFSKRTWTASRSAVAVMWPSPSSARVTFTVSVLSA